MAKFKEKIQVIDPDAVIGYRGSLAKVVNGPHKGNAPFDPSSFDVDAFIVSDKLSDAIKPNKGSNYKDAGRNSDIREIQKEMDNELRSKKCFDGMRANDPFTFRVFSKDEIAKKIAAGDVQIHF